MANDIGVLSMIVPLYLIKSCVASAISISTHDTHIAPHRTNGKHLPKRISNRLKTIITFF